MKPLIREFKVVNLIIFSFFLLPSSTGLRILGLFPLQVKSHYVMCEELMKRLAARGHQVDVYSHFPQKKTIPNFNDVSLEGSLPAMVNNMTYDFAVNTRGLQMVRNGIRDIGDSVCSLMGHPTLQKLLHDPPKDPPYDIIVTELSFTTCYIAWGRHMNLPVVAVVTSSLLTWMFSPFGNPINLATDPGTRVPYTPPMKFFERFHNFLTFHLLDFSINYYQREHHRHVEKYLGPGYPNSYELSKDVSLVLVNHESAFGGLKTFAPIIVPVGGLHVVDHNETLIKDVQNWLDDSKSGCIYFSFGSMARIESFPRHILNAFYTAFRNIAPVRVLMKIAEPKLLPPGLPSNVMTQSWLQQISVLKHKNVKAFVTHGGLMGIQESIYFGVPMVGIPLFMDQSTNVATSVKNKIALKTDLNEITDQKFTAILNEILQNPIYRKNVQVMSKKFKDRPLSPADTATYWVEYIHRHGKDALKSASVDIPWWQASLLDVCGFIALSLLLVLYVLVKMIKKLISLVTPPVKCSKLKIN